MQPSLFDPSTTIPTRRRVNQERDRILKQHEDTAGQRFMAAAKARVLQLLLERGPMSSERLTDLCKAGGLLPPAGKSDRAFGAVYMALSRAGRIRKVAPAIREKGHNTSGGNVWALAR